MKQLRHLRLSVISGWVKVEVDSLMRQLEQAATVKVPDFKIGINCVLSKRETTRPGIVPFEIITAPDERLHHFDY